MDECVLLGVTCVLLGVTSFESSVVNNNFENIYTNLWVFCRGSFGSITATYTRLKPVPHNPPHTLILHQSLIPPPKQNCACMPMSDRCTLSYSFVLLLQVPLRQFSLYSRSFLSFVLCVMHEMIVLLSVNQYVVILSCQSMVTTVRR